MSAPAATGRIRIGGARLRRDAARAGGAREPRRAPVLRARVRLAHRQVPRRRAGDSPRAEGAATYFDDRGRAVLAALDEVAANHATPVTAVSLAWLRQQPTVVAPIGSARNVDQFRDLALDAANRPA